MLDPGPSRVEHAIVAWRTAPIGMLDPDGIEHGTRFSSAKKKAAPCKQGAA